MKEKIVQVSGFAVGPPEQHAYLLVGVTNSGQVVMSQGDGDWAKVGPERNKSKAGNLEQENTELRAF